MPKRLVRFLGAAAIVVGTLGMASFAFAATPSVTSMKLTGSNVITVIYSEPVKTNTWDYTNFGGALSGLGVTSISGSGSNVITLTLSGAPNLTSNSGYITIGSGVTSLSTNSSFPGGSYNVTSAQAPILTSVAVTVQNIGSAFGALGSQVMLTFSTNESVVNPTVTLLGHTIGVSGTGVGPYTVNYTIASGDAQGTIPATINFTDTNGNSGSATVNILSNGTANTTIGTATITSNANSTGVLYPGSSIVFTLTPSTPIANPRSVTGSYNGVPLSWYSANGGVTYTATYIVAAGQANTTYPAQISGVTIIDQYGNTQGPFSGSDVQKTITAAAPTSPITIYQATAVPSLTASTNPIYSFVSTAPGTIHYAGDCTSQTTSAASGTNTVMFNTLAMGTHTNCTITVTDQYGNTSNQLVVSPFTIGNISSAPVTPPVATTSSNSTADQLQTLMAQLTALQAQAGTTTGGTTTTPTPTYRFTTFLGVGSTGAAVTALQQRLKADGYYSGPITGTFGAQTESAVKKFQSANRLAPKGYVGPGTRALLNEGK